MARLVQNVVNCSAVNVAGNSGSIWSWLVLSALLSRSFAAKAARNQFWKRESLVVFLHSNTLLTVRTLLRVPSGSNSSSS
jgi:hypothetical protein